MSASAAGAPRKRSCIVSAPGSIVTSSHLLQRLIALTDPIEQRQPLKLFLHAIVNFLHAARQSWFALAGAGPQQFAAPPLSAPALQRNQVPVALSQQLSFVVLQPQLLSQQQLLFVLQAQLLS